MQITKKIPNGKLVKITADIQNNTLLSVHIYGDFFLHPEDAIVLIESVFNNKSIPLNKEALEQDVKSVLIQQDAQLIGVNPEQLVEIIMEATQ